MLVIQIKFIVVTVMRGREGVTEQQGCKLEYAVQTNNISLARAVKPQEKRDSSMR